MTKGCMLTLANCSAMSCCTALGPGLFVPAHHLASSVQVVASGVAQNPTKPGALLGLYREHRGWLAMPPNIWTEKSAGMRSSVVCRRQRQQWASAEAAWQHQQSSSPQQGPWQHQQNSSPQ